MALVEPPQKCGLGHPLCDLHAAQAPDLDAMPGYDRLAPAGVCRFGCIARHLWQLPRDQRWYCRRHLRQALRVGGYPLPLE